MQKKIENGKYALYNESGDILIGMLTRAETATRTVWYLERTTGDTMVVGRSRDECIEKAATINHDFYVLLMS